MPLTEEFIELLRRPTEEITSTINQEFLQANDAIEILRFVGIPQESFAKLDPNYKSNVVDGANLQDLYDKFFSEDAENFKKMHKKASDVFKHVFTFLDQNQKQQVISDNEYELYRRTAWSGSFPQVNFLIEEAKKLEQETGQEILQPMISEDDYYGFRMSIYNSFGLEYEEEMRKTYQLILASVSEENRLAMITSTDQGDKNGNETTLLYAARNGYEDLVEYILKHVPENQLREVISSTIDHEDFPRLVSNKISVMVFQKASDLGIEDIDTQQILLQHKDLLLNDQNPYFAQYFKKHASEETLEATLASFLASPESKKKFFYQASEKNEELEPVVNSLILSPQIEPNLEILSAVLGLVKIKYGDDKQLAKSSRYLLAVLHLENNSNQHQESQIFANSLFSSLSQMQRQKVATAIIPSNNTATFRNNLISHSSKTLLDLYKNNPILLLENDLNQTTIDRLRELRIELIKKFSQENSDPSSKSDLVAEKKANLTIKGLLENDGLKKVSALADNILALSNKASSDLIIKISSYNSEITLKGLDRSERKVALAVIVKFLERPASEMRQAKAAILNSRQQNQDNSSKNSNEDSGVKAAEPEIITESVASEEVNFTSKVPANEESKPNPQIESPKTSNLKRSQQNQDNSSENPNESNDKKPRIR